MTSRGLPIAGTADAARNGIRPEARREARGVVAKWPTQERRKRHDDDCDPHLILEASSTGSLAVVSSSGNHRPRPPPRAPQRLGLRRLGPRKLLSRCSLLCGASSLFSWRARDAACGGWGPALRPARRCVPTSEFRGTYYI